MLTETTIYNHLITQGLVDITIYKTKPHEKVDDEGNYIFVSKVSDNVETQSVSGIFTRRARVSFVIVCKKSLSLGESAVDILNSYIEQLITIYDNRCSSAFVSNYEKTSPILYNEKDRPTVVLDFIFKY